MPRLIRALTCYEATLSVLALSPASCGGENGVANASDAAPLGRADATLGVQADGAQADDAAIETDSGAGFDGDADCPSSTPPDDPARTVTFVLTNTANADRLVVTNGTNCTPFTVDDLDVTSAWDPCHFEGPDAGGQFVQFTRLTVDASVMIPWDGRNSDVRSGSLLCAPNDLAAACYATSFVVRTAMVSGRHVAKFGISQGNAACAQAFFECRLPYGYGLGCDPDAGGGPSTSLSVPFDLPDSGPLTVQVQVP